MSTRTLVRLLVSALLAAACGREAPPPAPPAAPSAEAPASPKPEPPRVTASPDDPWRGSGLRFDQAAEALTPEGCHDSEQRFLACVHSVDAALAAAEPPLALSPLAHPHAEVPGATVHARFGLLAVVSRRPEAEGEAPDTLAARLRREIAAWKAAYARAAGAPLDWPAIAAWVRTHRLTPDTEPATTAAAINGFLATAKDPFHRIVPTEREDALRERAGTTHVGVGVYIRLGDGGAPFVSGLAPDGPAARADLRVGDLVAAVDGHPAAGLTADEVALKLRGEEGTEVTLGVSRAGAPLTFTLTRTRLATRYVQEATLRAGERRLGYLSVPTFFSTHICAQLADGARRLAASGVEALLVDLRGNGGGLVDEARCAAGLFLPPGRLIARLARDGADDVTYTTDPAAPDGPGPLSLPLVVLVDAATGSAAEILAGALQDEGRAVVVGERTYGKGTVQNPFPWGDGLDVTVYFTSGRYHLPSGRGLHLVGVVPDVDLADLGIVPSRAGGAPRVDLEYLSALIDPGAEAAEVERLVASRQKSAAPLAACTTARARAASGWVGDGPAGREPLGAALVGATAAALCAAAPHHDR